MVGELDPILTSPGGRLDALTRRFFRLPATPLTRETQARARRVVTVLFALAALGLADLAFTLTFMTTTGMAEANPLARTMIALGGAPQLIRFKLLTILVSSYFLWLVRHHRAAERSAWILFAALVGLSIHWVQYVDTMATVSAVAIDPAVTAADEAWIHIPN